MSAWLLTRNNRRFFKQQKKTRACVETYRQHVYARIPKHTLWAKRKIRDKSPTSHCETCCYCIASGNRERHEHTQWTWMLFFMSDVKLFVTEVLIPINSVERFGEKMGTAHLSSFFTVTSPPSCTCMVVETKGSWVCLTAQDRPSLSRRPGLRCAWSRNKGTFEKRKKRYWAILCIGMYSHSHGSHTLLHCNFFIEHYVISLDIMALHWTPHCISIINMRAISNTRSASSYIFNCIHTDAAIIMIHCYVLMCNVTYAWSAVLSHICRVEHRCIAL